MDGNRHPNTILVNTGSNEDPKERLSKFYHFDAPSQLTIGHRIAVVRKHLCFVVVDVVLLSAYFCLFVCLLMIYDRMLSVFFQQKRNLITFH